MSRTAQEIKATMGATQNRLDAMTKRIDDMNARIAERTKDIHRQYAAEGLKAQFSQGKEINHYSWNYERSWHLGTRCFASNALVIPGTKAYKGSINEQSVIDNADFFLYPKEIWLSKEEFTVRRLKGQL